MPATPSGAAVLAMPNDVVRRLFCRLQGIIDGPMSLRLRRSNFVTIISAYAPTTTGSDEIKFKFYEDLHDLLTSVPRTNKWTVLGDFNARVGTYCTFSRRELGPNGIAGYNGEPTNQGEKRPFTESVSRGVCVVYAGVRLGQQEG
nr:unnamed protein product [Spirometra erinaceieuropaei]